MALITRVPRYRPELQWSNLWVSNVFRVYEQIFGRRWGVKKEISKNLATGVYAAHSWEAVCVLAEVYIRDIIKLRKFAKVRIWIPVLMTPQGIPLFASPYLFAISNDNATLTNGSASPQTISFAATGSNLTLLAGVTEGVSATETVSSVTWNGSGLTNSVNQRLLADAYTSLWSILNAASGTHNLVVTSSITTQSTVIATYSGTSGSALDNTVANSQTLNASFSSPITVNTANSWIVGFINENFGRAHVAGANTTNRVDNGSLGGGTVFADSNGTQTVGSHSLNESVAGAAPNWVGLMASIAPFVPPAPSSFFIAMLQN